MSMLNRIKPLRSDLNPETEAYRAMILADIRPEAQSEEIRMQVQKLHPRSALRQVVEDLHDGRSIKLDLSNMNIV